MSIKINESLHEKPPGKRCLKDYLLEAVLGFFFALLMGIAYFGSGFELEFIYQGF
ncbi:MAG: hypothetical protein KDI65_08100 [Alphaproteobacteria bacterium]|nr:hypothetical protein [Alphaproteobacteria bacterium]